MIQQIEHVESIDRFEQLRSTESLLVVDFYSTECPPCEKLAPIYERYAEKYSHVKFAKVFRQGNRELAKSLGVSGSPTVLFFKNGILLDKHLSGDISEVDFAGAMALLVPNESVSAGSAVSKKIVEKRDLCIVGIGPAGMTAAIYGARYKVDQVIVGELSGGLMSLSHEICNYPSEISISGMDLTQKMWDHVVQLEVPNRISGVATIGRFGDYYELVLTTGEIIQARNIILTTGTKHKHLGLPNEEALTGRGVSYCATCDAAFFGNKTVAVIGGGDSANKASLYLARVAKKVYQIYRGEKLKGEVAWIDQIKQNDKIEVIYSTEVKELVGSHRLESVLLSNPVHGSDKLLLDGLFIEIGSEPDSSLINVLHLETDKGGYIVTEQDQRTSVPGIWAAGDITTNSNGFRQIITACSEGAIAAQSVFNHLQKNS